MSERKAPPDMIHGVPFAVATSTMQKSIRRGDRDNAVRFGVELFQSGFGKYLWRRLAVIASEDIGPADRHLLAALRESWAEEVRHKKGDGAMYVVHALLLLATAPKSREACHGTLWAFGTDEPLEVPDYALDRHTAEGRKRGRGWEHFWSEAVLLPDPEIGELQLPDDRYAERARRTTGE